VTNIHSFEKKGISMTQKQLFSQDRDVDQTLLADVLVIGGGPAGTWSAWSAANAGAKVVSVDNNSPQVDIPHSCPE
jgi:heterodisulfide reductase subunit A-like polyferredoxin